MTHPAFASEEVMRANFPNAYMHTGGWRYEWAGRYRLVRVVSGELETWAGYTPPPHQIDDLIGMDDPNG